MFASLRKFASTKIAGVFVFIIIIPFVFWGMGSVFSGGNTNNIAKINNTKVSTKDFMEYLNQSGIDQQTIKENLDKNIIEELLSGLISTKLLSLEINDINISISERTLLQKIKTDKFFLDENNIFQRTKYEKFLLSNNMSAAIFEQRVKNRELQKHLFDFVGAGTITPKFLVKKDFEEENKILEIKYFSLDNLYKKRKDFTEIQINQFIEENKEKLQKEHIDFKYSILNPKNLLGLDDFNQEFFNKIDEIENLITQGKDIEAITKELDLNLNLIKVNNYIPTQSKKINEDKIYKLREKNYDIIENGDNFLLFKIINKYDRLPKLNDKKKRNEIIELIFRKNKFDFNKKVLEEIQSKIFDDDKFNKMGGNNIKNLSINSVVDDSKFEINSVKTLYTLKDKDFTLVSDQKNKIYLVQIENSLKKIFNNKDKNFLEFAKKLNIENRSTILKSYDQFLNNKYKIELNQKTIERVKNYFK